MDLIVATVVNMPTSGMFFWSAAAFLLVALALSFKKESG